MKIVTLVNSPIAKRLREAESRSLLWRETPFVLAMPATRLYSECRAERGFAPRSVGAWGRSPHYEDDSEKILVHGIIDCHFEENGKLILLDFKSDRIPEQISLAEWAEKHRVQLEIYARALGEATKKDVAEMLLYSFSRGEIISLDFLHNFKISDEG